MSDDFTGVCVCYFFLQIFKVLENSPVTMDFRPDRVRIIVNAEDIVVHPPVTG